MFRLLIYSLLMSAAMPSMAVFSEEHTVPTYRAIYDIRYKDRLVGESEITVIKNQVNGTYIFSSKSNATGLLKLIAPKTLVEISEFSYNHNHIQPQQYSFENGRNRGSYSVSFNWDENIVITTENNQITQSTLVPGTLDHGSMQVAIMLKMQQSEPLSQTIRDDDGIREYDYSLVGEEIIETSLGPITAKKLIQQRRNSSRQTVLWLAKDFQYLPVRIEQKKNNASRVILEIQSLEWLLTNQ
jgi:hypothetical protein